MADEKVIETARQLSSFPGALSIVWEQFRHCNAYTSQCLQGKYYLIKSYSTIVGLVNVDSGDFYEIGKYSPTTSKQVTQIYRARFSNCERHFVGGRV